MHRLVLASFLVLFACGEEEQPPDAGFVDSGVQPDASEQPDAGVDCSQISERCAEANSIRCSNTGYQECILVDDCWVWSEERACDVGRCVGDRCHSCAGLPGTFHSQSITHQSEDRFYYLYVPSSYTCDTPMAMQVDFHGTAGDLPEEAYGLADQVALAERRGFILVRPRSRSDSQGEIYRWDQNPGDLVQNVGFTEALVAAIAEQYHVDRARSYASGFSSGTNMASQFLAGELFQGFGLVGGGWWNAPQLGSLTGSTTRIYAVTGYRDYLYFALRDLIMGLEAAGWDAERLLFEREVDTGHELYDWHFEEMWTWMDRGERPEEGMLSMGWTADTGFTDTDSLLEIEEVDGDLLVAGVGGIWRWDAVSMQWTAVRITSPSFSPALTGICCGAGQCAVVGEGWWSTSIDNGSSWQSVVRVPELNAQYFGYAYLNDVACLGNQVLGGGYWAGLHSEDFGQTWNPSRIRYTFADVPAQLSSVEISSSSTAVAIGSYYVGWSTDRVTFTESTPVTGAHWYNGLVSGSGGRWWIAGDTGVIKHSTNDGRSWQDQGSGTMRDLYAIDFWDDQVGMAVGANGVALLTLDGGALWQDVSTGLDRYLGSVKFVSADRALVVGERGTVLWFER